MQINKERVLILILTVITVLLITAYTFVDTLVIRKGYIESVENDCVVIVDTFGEAWEYNPEAGEDFQPEQKVRMFMDNNSTEREITDDIILKIIVDK